MESLVARFLFTTHHMCNLCRNILFWWYVDQTNEFNNSQYSGSQRQMRLLNMSHLRQFPPGLIQAIKQHLKIGQQTLKGCVYI